VTALPPYPKRLIEVDLPIVKLCVEQIEDIP
jgi:hypothetical protein